MGHLQYFIKTHKQTKNFGLSGPFILMKTALQEKVLI